MEDVEATMEMVLPLLVTDVMQYLEDQGKQPERDFTQLCRVALLKMIPQHPTIEDDVWDQGKKKALIERMAALIKL